MGRVLGDLRGGEDTVYDFVIISVSDAVKETVCGEIDALVAIINVEI